MMHPRRSHLSLALTRPRLKQRQGVRGDASSCSCQRFIFSRAFSKYGTCSRCVSIDGGAVSAGDITAGGDKVAAQAVSNAAGSSSASRQFGYTGFRFIFCFRYLGLQGLLFCSCHLFGFQRHGGVFGNGTVVADLLARYVKPPYAKQQRRQKSAIEQPAARV